MKSSLLSALVLSAILWPVGAYAQTGPNSMGKAVQPDEMKWEPLEGGFEISILYTNPVTQATYLVIRQQFSMRQTCTRLLLGTPSHA